MTEQTVQEAYMESCLIDLSKQLTASEKRIAQMEKGFRDILGTKCQLEHESMILIRIIAKACLVGAVDESGSYCFVPEGSWEKKDD
jgi:hypothetical protein